MLDVSIRTELLRLMLDLRARARPDLPVHHPRPVARLGDRRPDRGDVPRQDHGDRAGGGGDPRRRGNPYTAALVSVSPSPEPPTAGERAEADDPRRRDAGCRPHPDAAAASGRAVRWPSIDVRGGAAALRRRRRPTRRRAGSRNRTSVGRGIASRGIASRGIASRGTSCPGGGQLTPRAGRRVTSLAAFGVAVALAIPAGTSGAERRRHPPDRHHRGVRFRSIPTSRSSPRRPRRRCSATTCWSDWGPTWSYAPTGFAESWVREGSTWTFTIREGLRWSDGRSANAEDVAFTYDYLLASMDPAYIGPWAPAGNDLPRSGATRGDGRPDKPAVALRRAPRRGDRTDGGRGRRLPDGRADHDPAHDAAPRCRHPDPP